MQLIKEINLNILLLKTHKITSTFCGEYMIILLKRMIESNRKERRKRKGRQGWREKKKKERGQHMDCTDICKEEKGALKIVDDLF